MDYCKFYGISGAQLVLKALPTRTLNSFVKPLNNVIDYKILQDLKLELRYISSFLENTISEDYSDKKMKMLNMQVRRNENSKLRPNEVAMSDSELSDAKKVLESAEKSISQRVGALGTELTLTTEEVEIVKYFSRRRKVIERHLDSIEEKSFSERKVFGKPLFRVYLGEGRDIKAIVSTELSKTKKDKGVRRTLMKRYREDTDLLLEFIDNDLKQEDIKLKDKQDYVTITVPNSIIGPDRVVMEQIIKKNRSIGKHDVNNIELVYDMYNIANSFTVEFYNATFGLDCSRAEYEVMFNRLADIGLAGLNFHTVDFFHQFINTVTFAKEHEMKIPYDSPLAGAITLIDRLLKTDLKVGANIE